MLPIYSSDTTVMLRGFCIHTLCNRLWLFFKALVPGII